MGLPCETLQVCDKQDNTRPRSGSLEESTSATGRAPAGLTAFGALDMSLHKNLELRNAWRNSKELASRPSGLHQGLVGPLDELGELADKRDPAGCLVLPP